MNTAMNTATNIATNATTSTAPSVASNTFPSGRRAGLAPLLALPLVCMLAWAAVGLLALTPAAASAATLGSGKSATEARSLPAFNAIQLQGPIDLSVRQGPQQPVQVQADDKLLALLETVVEQTASGPTLVARFKPGESWYSRVRIHLTVTVPTLNSITAAGSGDLRIESLSVPALALVLSGSGDARFDALSTEDFKVRISGSGDVSAKGSATRVNVSIAGSGDVHLSELKADAVEVSIAGSGDAAVQARKSLNVRIAGSGDVSYSGDAQVRSTVAGSGSVSKR